ncbi:hypothetical protein ACIHCQ_39990 [Streptomyces sp. NPDC052236]|uniref:hypothetical protein n=1 Tax=Streptomyces sp. NPDC052236 TaxID=3365686 RepID=UPI0037D98A52
MRAPVAGSMTAAGEDGPILRTTPPSVYLDQWVWVRLAQAALGKPRESFDTQVLTAVQEASAAGVAFPLSSTHYFETSQITDPRQRMDVARVMASVSLCRTLRSHAVLLRHQLLHAMHVSFARPAFRPTAPEPLGVGVAWAFQGERSSMDLFDASGRVDSSSIPGLRPWLRRVNQLVEFQVLAGPADSEVEELRRLGYRPETVVASDRSRLAWEEFFTDLLKGERMSREELRVRVQARELVHEYMDVFGKLLAEYRVDLWRAVGFDPRRPRSGRPGMTAFADRVPSLRITVDLKVQLFRNPSKPWKASAIHDIDALSIAVPYCHVVVPDSEMGDLLSRSAAAQRNDTRILRRLRDLPDALADLTASAAADRSSAAGAGLLEPGEVFCTDMETLRNTAPHLPKDWHTAPGP